MVTISVLEVIGTPQAILRCFGVKVYRLASRHLKKGISVSISFEGIQNVNFPFCTSLVGCLYNKFPPTENDSMVTLKDFPTDEFSRDDMREAVYFAINPEAAELWNSLLDDSSNGESDFIDTECEQYNGFPLKSYGS